MIAALFVETNGCYFGLPDVDPWDIERDAREYTGPHPVVAHPPCQLWVNLAAVNQERYNRKAAWKGGDDGGCFASALASVRKWGGVLEHPAFTHAWASHGLLRPTLHGWNRDAFGPENEWTCEVWQSSYGHPARKRTWLLYVGRDRRCPPDMLWERETGTHQVGWFDRKKPTLGKKAANATPPAFRDALLNLARLSRGDRRAA